MPRARTSAPYGATVAAISRVDGGRVCGATKEHRSGQTTAQDRQQGPVRRILCRRQTCARPLVPLAPLHCQRVHRELGSAAGVAIRHSPPRPSLHLHCGRSNASTVGAACTSCTATSAPADGKCAPSSTRGPAGRLTAACGGEGRGAIGLTRRRDGTRRSALTKVIAMDCEMVGVGADGRRSALARVSVVRAELSRSMVTGASSGRWLIQTIGNRTRNS
jgi:hypothetical protein